MFDFIVFIVLEMEGKLVMISIGKLGKFDFVYLIRCILLRLGMCILVMSRLIWVCCSRLIVLVMEVD